ncbi:hypothetical protein LOD99_5898 [Oopsacas minuta]|uniref:Uncharacterized protein n=1 Tax=Oopsacas minuta TaxID=111878 RepID=A0AAV7JP37_9METZ|nr:hypothetical protein LOD99_5898 [Oopsacas minuta]
MRPKYMQCALLLSILVLNLFILGRSEAREQNGNGGNVVPNNNNKADTTQASIPEDTEKELEVKIMMMLSNDKNGLKKTETFIKVLEALLKRWDIPDTPGASKTESTTLSAESNTPEVNAITPPSNTTNATSVITASPTEAEAPDAGPVTPDAGPVTPDAGPVTPDAEPVAPDAEPVAPDAEPVAPDAEPVAPDAEHLMPNATPGVPDKETKLDDTNTPIAPLVTTKHFYQTSVFSFFLFCSFFTIIALFFCYISRRKIKVYFYKNFNGGRNSKGHTRAPTLEDAMPSFTDVKN